MANINRDDAPQSNKSFQFSIWKRLGPFIKPYRWLLLLIIVTNIIISIVDVLLPLFQRYAVDNFIEQKSLQGFQTFIFVYLAVIVLQGEPFPLEPTFEALFIWCQGLLQRL